MKTVDFSETIAAFDMKIGKCRQLIEFMKVCEYSTVGETPRSGSNLPVENCFHIWKFYPDREGGGVKWLFLGIFRKLSLCKRLWIIR